MRIAAAFSLLSVGKRYTWYVQIVSLFIHFHVDTSNLGLMSNLPYILSNGRDFLCDIFHIARIDTLNQFHCEGQANGL